MLQLVTPVFTNLLWDMCQLVVNPYKYYCVGQEQKQ